MGMGQLVAGREGRARLLTALSLEADIGLCKVGSRLRRIFWNNFKWIMNCFNVYKTLICNSKKIVTYYGWDVGTKKEAFKKHIQTAQQQPCSSAPSSLRPSHGNCIRKGIPSLRSHNVKPFPLPPFFSALWTAFSSSFLYGAKVSNIGDSSVPWREDDQKCQLAAPLEEIRSETEESHFLARAGFSGHWIICDNPRENCKLNCTNDLMYKIIGPLHNVFAT